MNLTSSYWRCRLLRSTTNLDLKSVKQALYAFMDSSSFSRPLNETKYGAKKSAGLLACSLLYASSSSYCKDKQRD